MKNPESTKNNTQKKYNNFTKILIFFILVLLCLVLTLFVVVVKNGLLTKLDHKPCTTPDCITSSAQIIDLIDPNYNPCENFDSFVCGNYLKKSITIPSWRETTLKQLNPLITEKNSREPLGEPLKNQKFFYQACLNTSDDATETFLDVLEHLSSWPVLKGRLWNERKFDWFLSIAQSARVGLKNDFFLKILPKQHNKTLRLAVLPPDPIKIQKNTELYIDLMVKVAVDLGAPLNQAESEFMRVFQFEEELAAIINDDAGLNNHQEEELVPLKQLEEIYPLAWADLANNITGSKSFSNETLVVLKRRNYLESLTKFLAAAPKKVQANYLVWKIVESFQLFLKASVQEKFQKFYAVTSNDVPLNRKEFCLSKAKELFPSVAEMAHIRKYVWPEKRAEIKEIIHRIKAQLSSRIKSNKWMDKRAKNITITQLNTKLEMVGCSDRVYEKDYDQMEWFVQSENVVEMVTRLTAKNNAKLSKFFNEDIAKLQNFTLLTSPILNSLNNLTESDALILPGSVLQEFFYDPQRPNYMNYAAIGSIISHEFTHDLITRGIDLWPLPTREIFESKTKQCFSKGFTNKNSEAEMLDERDIAISDFIAPNLAYETYQEWIKSHGQEHSLVGINYTPNQVFWIMFGALKCYQTKLLPGNRLIMPRPANLLHSPYFVKDFQCSREASKICDIF